MDHNDHSLPSDNSPDDSLAPAARTNGNRRRTLGQALTEIERLEALIQRELTGDSAPVAKAPRRASGPGLAPQRELSRTMLLHRRLVHTTLLIVAGIGIVAGLALGLRASVERHSELRAVTPTSNATEIGPENSAAQ